MYEEQEIRLQRILTDRGTEYCGKVDVYFGPSASPKCGFIRQELVIFGPKRIDGKTQTYGSNSSLIA